MATYTVYKHICPSNKVYIGITSQDVKKRWENGRGYRECPRFYCAIKKYGWENIKHEILYSGLTKAEAEETEIRLIKEYKSNDKRYGYNIESGGNCAGTHSEETKKKISLGNKGKKFSAVSIERMKKAHKGQGIGESNSFYGRHHTEKARKAQSEFMKGNTYNKGNHHTDKFKAEKSRQMKEKYSDGKNPRCRKIIGCGIEYFSLREAARVFGVSVSTIHKWIYDANNIEWRFAS